MRRYLGLALVAAVGCSQHPPEGTAVTPGRGVAGIPGGPSGTQTERATPVLGGTLAINASDVAVVADPDRDRVFVVDLASSLVREIPTAPGAEPGRVVFGAGATAFVALRRTGQVMSVDTTQGVAREVRSVCPAPRGMAYDALAGRLHVACATGELVSFADTGKPTRHLQLGGDLRDVLIDGTRLLVTRFKSAELLVLDENGEVSGTVRPQVSPPQSAKLGVAWRALRLNDGTVAMLHQIATADPVRPEPGGYGSGASNPCSPAIAGEGVSRLDPEQSTAPNLGVTTLPMFAGPTDVAVSPDGTEVSFSNLANAWNPEQLPTVVTLPLQSIGMQPCGAVQPEPRVPGEPVALAYAKSGQLWVQSREPATLQRVGGGSIVLSTDSRADTGFALFHMNSGSGIACVSCHADGSEDGRVWDFAGIGPRRTQALGGGVLSRAPFHWDGDIEDFDSLVHEVFVSRMGAERPNLAQRQLFARYVNRLEPPSRPVVDSARAQRGEKLFETAECSSCHSGPSLTNVERFDVGTGGTFKVPSLLGIAARAPFMHDGCAETLIDRFGPCGGQRHGDLTGLDAEDLKDLTAYLETL